MDDCVYAKRKWLPEIYLGADFFFIFLLSSEAIDPMTIKVQDWTNTHTHTLAEE